jgi:hypothetical protein
MDAVIDVLGVSIGALISLAVVAAIVFQWRDDHNWMHRPRR